MMKHHDFISLARAAGHDIFVLPVSGPVQGMAWATPAGLSLINIYGWGAPAEFARVVAHEMGHHKLGHTVRWDSRPKWGQEFDAEIWALRLLQHIFESEVMADLDRQAKDYLRPFIQGYIDAEIFVHGEEHALRMVNSNRPLISQGVAP